MITPYSNIISVTTLEALLLDTYSGAAAAYSLRKLSASYTGSAIKVRRSVGSPSEKDIGFVNNELDVADLESFCSGTDGFVVTWYDQSGNGYDATQTTAANQPQIVSSGSVILDGGKPATTFNGSSNFLTTSNCNFASTDKIYTAIVANSQTSNATRLIFALSDNSTYRSFAASYFQSTGRFAAQFSTDNINTQTNAFNNYNINNQYLIETLFDTNNASAANRISIYSNNTLLSFVSNTNNLKANIFGNNKPLSIGADGLGNFRMQGKIQEIIFYPFDQTSNRSGIETNINANYQIYWDGSQTSLLDTYSGSAAAYSLRALSSAYTGPLVRVRRASDNAEQDIYAKYDGTLNVSALESFCSGTDGFVKTWYDQSGNGRNATQTTAANQPQIVSSGSVILEGSKPTLQFDGSNDTLSSSVGFLNNAANVYSSVVFSTTSTTTNQIVHSNPSGESNFRGYDVRLPNSNQIQLSIITNPSNTVTNAVGNFNYSSGNYNLLTGTFNASLSTNEQKIYGNASLVAQVSNSGNSIRNSGDNGGMLIGSFGTINNFGAFLNGNVAELIFYTSDQSSNRTGIETNINSFYSIY